MPWMSVAIGAVTFIVAHLIEAGLWGFFGGAHDPWFLNSGRAVAFTAACFFTAGVVVGTRAHASPLRQGAFIGLGGALAAAVVLFARVGAGTLFPVALTIGTLVLVASAAAGSVTARLAKRRSSAA